MDAKMKVRKRSLLGFLLALLPMVLVMTACPQVDPENKREKEKIDADPDYDAKEFLRKQYMDVFYYWNEEVKDRNATYKPYDYEIYDYFDKLLYAKDHWSWMCDKEYYISSETGVKTGTWGISLDQAIEYYHDYGLRVRYIYPGSPMERFGVTRGAVLTRVAGYNVEDDDEGFTTEKLKHFKENYYKSPQTFTFRLVDGRDTSFTASMASSLATRTALVTRVFQPGEFPGLKEPVGYFLYLSFRNNFLDDVHQAMQTFHSAGVRKVIIDLRYNGGGDSKASQLLVDYLAPRSADGQIYVVRHHNEYLRTYKKDSPYSDENNTETIIPSSKTAYDQDDNEGRAYWDKVSPNRIDPEAIYVITGEGTASASEMVINGLRPYMGDKLQMVGDTTYGKPNGMYVLMYPGSNSDYDAYQAGDFTKLQWVFLPICFFNQNSKGESIPVDGLLPDHYRPDDLYHDFGVEEDLVKACLTRIVSGTYPPLSASGRRGVKSKAPDKPGCRIETDENRPGYGLYTVKPPVNY